MVNKREIFPIGIGTYGIDLNNLDKEVQGLEYSVDKGENYISISMMYENGEIVKNLKKFINENIESINFEMKKEDYEKLNKFRNIDFDSIKIDWNNSGEGIQIDQLANQLD